jgi:TonB family protein
VYLPPPPRPARPQPIPAPPQPAIRLQAPDAAPPPVLSGTIPEPRIQTDVFARLDMAAGSGAGPILPVHTGSFAGPGELAREARRRGVADAGFGSLEAGPAASASRAVVRSTSFDPPAAAAPPAPPKSAPAGLSTPVEILDKPNPSYTDVARRLHIEGDVLLSVRFRAAGSVEVLAILHGLGYGLDEQAAEAARRIRFRPALSGGVAVDTEATLRVSFRLAF